MPQWPADRVERRALGSLVPYAQNARTHSDEQVAQIAASMREWGWTNPVLVDEVGRIICGHGRVLAARQLGLTEVPVMVAVGWTDAQKRAYVLTDNQLPLNAGWDMDRLGSEVKGLAEWGFDTTLLGFPNLDALMGAPDNGLAADVDDIPEPPAAVVTRAGDLWQLGPHRILCGDCRDPATVARALAGRRINVGFTSPPYAMQREYDASSGFEPIPPDDYVAWFAPVASNVAAHLADDGSWFVNIKPAGRGLDTELYVIDLVLAHARQWGWHFATEFCWERTGVPKAVTQRFKNQFEPVYQFVRNRWKMRPDAVRHASDNVPIAGGPGVGQTNWANAQGGNGPMFGAAKRRKHGTSTLMSDTQGTNTAPGEYIGPGLAYPGNRLPTFTSSHEATGHTAAFPVGLPAFFSRAYGDDGDLIFDPFCGSGSTIIAAAATNRIGAGIDIAPPYIDITVARYRRLYPDHAVVLADDGRSYDSVAAERLKDAA
jgi:DNA modification methylase